MKFLCKILMIFSVLSGQSFAQKLAVGSHKMPDPQALLNLEYIFRVAYSNLSDPDCLKKYIKSEVNLSRISLGQVVGRVDIWETDGTVSNGSPVNSFIAEVYYYKLSDKIVAGDYSENPKWIERCICQKK